MSFRHYFVLTLGLNDWRIKERTEGVCYYEDVEDPSVNVEVRKHVNVHIKGPLGDVPGGG